MLMMMMMMMKEVEVVMSSRDWVHRESCVTMKTKSIPGGVEKYFVFVTIRDEPSLLEKEKDSSVEL